MDATAADALRGAQKVSAHLLTAGQLDALQKQVHDEAFKRGFDEGLAAGKAELASRVARLAALAESFGQPFQSLERSVEEELVNLSVELASHLVRHEIAHDPALLHSAINDCLGVLASTVREVTLHLNPEDAALVRARASRRGLRRALRRVAADHRAARAAISALDDAAARALIDGGRRGPLRRRSWARRARRDGSEP